MSIEQLDHIFPFVVFVSGVLMVFLLDGPWSKFIAIAVRRSGHRPQLRKWAEQFENKRLLAYTLLFIGGIWSLQNLWLGSIFH